MPSLLEDPHCCRDVHVALLPPPKIKARDRTLSKASALPWAWCLLKATEEREMQCGLSMQKGVNVLCSMHILAKAEKEPC